MMTDYFNIGNIFYIGKISLHKVLDNWIKKEYQKRINNDKCENVLVFTFQAINTCFYNNSIFLFANCDTDYFLQHLQMWWAL